MPKTLNILLPVLNEQDRLESGVRTLAAFVIKHNIPCMLTIIDNGSSDATQEIALSLTRDSALELESRISAPRRVDRPPSLISLRGLQSHDSNSKILESRNENPQTSKNLRIFEEKQATQELSSRADEVLFPSSRASVASVAIHTQNKDSSRGTMDCHATASAVSRNDNKNAVFQKMDSRENATNMSKSKAAANEDSSTEANLNEPAKDSRIFAQNAQNVFCSQVDRRQDFEARIVALQGESRAHTWAYVTADSPQQSAILVQKPTPKPSKAQPSKNAQPSIKIQYLRLHQKGVGLALQAGIDHNAALPRPCEFIGYMDIDLSTDLTHLLEVYDKLCQGHPIVVGSRLLQGSQVIGRKLLRELTSKTLNTIIKAALHTSFSDAMCGFKFYRADIAALLRQQCSDDPSWFYCAQMLIQAQALGIEIEEIPVRWEDDALGSKVQVAKLARIYLKEIYRLRHLRRAILAHKS